MLESIIFRITKRSYCFLLRKVAVMTFLMTLGFSLLGCGKVNASVSRGSVMNEQMPGDDASSTMITGGSDTKYLDLPKAIQSEEIVHFSVDCNFAYSSNEKKYTYVYGYATKVEGGALVGLSYRKDGEQNEAEYTKLKLVGNEVFSDLQKLVKKHNFASNNGYTHFTSGLPENFGGSVNINYASGEQIIVSDNQSIVISLDAGEEMVGILQKYMDAAYDSPNYAGDIVAVSYKEQTGKDIYTQYYLDGTRFLYESKLGKNQKVYKKEYALPQDMLYKIRDIANTNSLLDWSGMRQSEQNTVDPVSRQLVFSMRNGNEIMVTDSSFAPMISNGATFAIQTYLNDLRYEADAGFPNKADFLFPKTVDYDMAYCEVLDAIYRIVEKGSRGQIDFSEMIPDHLVGILENSVPSDALDSIGYIYQDLNQDGVQELLVGVNEQSEYNTGTRIMNVFYFDGIKGRDLANGWYRNAWFLLDNGELYRQGSSGAAHTTEATYTVSKDGRELVCKDMYFSAPSNEENRIEWYRNPNGLDALDAKGVSKVSEEEYNVFNEACRRKQVRLNLTPISSWGIPSVHVDEKSKMKNPPKDFSQYYDDEMGKGMDVIISSEEVLRDFSYLHLTLDTIDEEGKPHYKMEEVVKAPRFDTAMLVNISFLEHASNRGISYLDRFGNRVYFHIYMSGLDGSLKLERFVP